MILIDTGPLVAIANRREPSHPACVNALRRLSPPVVTTYPVLTEAMYLVGRVGGWQLQQTLWEMVVRGAVEIGGSDSELGRMMELMSQYRDVPMALAAASLVALAEDRGLDQVFTLDSDFHVYRLFGRRQFTVIP